MNDTDLIDRYVYAATRSVPERQRRDVADELRASIHDQIDDRAASGEDLRTAERAVLLELGDPDKLAAGFSDRPAYLIGPRYYFEWWRLLKLLLWIVVPIAALGIALGQVLSGAGVGDIFAGATVGALAVALHVCFWTTLVFAILERSPDVAARADRGVRGTPWPQWTLEQLPDPRPAGLGVGDLVASLVFLGIAAIAAVWDQLVGFVRTDSAPLPVLNPDLWPWGIAFLLVLIAAEAIFAVVLHRARRWTFALAVTNAVLALAFAAPALLLLLQGELLNPAFFVEVIPADSSAEVFRVTAVVTGCAIIGIAGWDIVDGGLKAWRSRRITASDSPSGRRGRRAGS